MEELTFPQKPKSVEGEPEFWTILKLDPEDFRSRTIEEEMTALFSGEIQKEIDAEIIKNLVKMAEQDLDK